MYPWSQIEYTIQRSYIHNNNITCSIGSKNIGQIILPACVYHFSLEISSVIRLQSYCILPDSKHTVNICVSAAERNSSGKL